MCLLCMSAWTEAAGDESVSRSFAGTSSTFQCALLSKLRLLSPHSPSSMSCDHGAGLPVLTEACIQNTVLDLD